MRIVEYPHPALLRPTVELKQIDADLRRDVAEMFDLMYEARGVGLAANQVALPYRLLVMNLDVDGFAKEAEEVFINPKIVARAGSIEDEEGCLSFPGLSVKIRRARDVTIEAVNGKGELVQIQATGLASRAWQHEIDHLDGKVFVERFGQLARLAHRRDVDRFEQRFRRAQKEGRIPPSAEIEQALDLLRARMTDSPSA